MSLEETEYQSITFFVPCLNEEGNIGKTIDNIVEVLSGKEWLDYEILVVDDASTDNTVGEVEDWQQKYPDVSLRLIRNPVTRGLGRNYFFTANAANHFHYMLINGDAAEPIESIRILISHLGKADTIIPYFGKNETRTWSRRMLSQSFTALANLLSGHNLKYYNGPVIHKTENVRMWFSETAGFGYQAELLCRLLDEGNSYLEVQITNSDRNTGASKAFTLGNLLSVANSLSHVLLRRFERLVFKVLTK